MNLDLESENECDCYGSDKCKRVLHCTIDKLRQVMREIDRDLGSFGSVIKAETDFCHFSGDGYWKGENLKQWSVN